MKGFIFGVLIGTFLTAAGCYIGYVLILNEHTYRTAQIEALTGKARYELKTYPDSTREWIEK
jgi:ABC-type lipoprotein release transport system permease subunit